MIKAFTKTIFSILTVFVLAGFAYAFNVNPSTGTFNVGDSTNFTIIANPNTDNVLAVQLRLSVQGGTITTYAVNPVFLDIGAGDCAPQHYISSKICDDIASSSSYITNVTHLGTFSVQWTASGEYSFVKNGSAYVNSYTNDVVTDNGTVGDFIVSGTNPTPTPTGHIPVTAMSTSDVTITSGVVVIGGGIILKIYVGKKQKYL